MSSVVKEVLLVYEKTKLLVKLSDTSPAVPVKAVIFKTELIPWGN